MPGHRDLYRSRASNIEVCDDSDRMIRLEFAVCFKDVGRAVPLRSGMPLLIT